MPSAMPARASSSTSSPACGIRGPTTPSSATSSSGIYFDPAKLHVLNHKGKYLKVRGPLNIARPIQGWPVMVQAGASDAGRQLAAETAEMVFAAGGPIEAGRAFYADVKGRAAQDRPQSRSHQDPARRLHHHRRLARRGEGEARPARQPGELRQRHRRAVDRDRPGCAQVRSRRAAARDPRDQPEQERPRAGDRARQAREPDGAPDRRPAGRLWRARHDGHAQDDRRPDGGVAR